MSTESLGPENEQAPPLSVVEFERYLEAFNEVIDEPLDIPSFDREDYPRRTQFSVVMSQHIYNQVQALNYIQTRQGKGQYSVIPQGQVEYCIRDILSIAEKMPLRKGELLHTYRPFFEDEQLRYLQIIKTIQLGRELQSENHPLACCATDVLLGYGMAIAQGVR